MISEILTFVKELIPQVGLIPTLFVIIIGTCGYLTFLLIRAKIDSSNDQNIVPVTEYEHLTQKISDCLVGITSDMKELLVHVVGLDKSIQANNDMVTKLVLRELDNNINNGGRSNMNGGEG